jgi:2-polyprenyl-3-methyl-5-hydroxy-6-metoxy-1,4-benzoquinol methylase
MEYAFPHDDAAEDRRLELFQQRLDPLTKRRVERLGIGPGARCLEVAGGRGSIARWLCERVGPAGHVTATDLDTGFLERLEEPNLTVLQHDVRVDDPPTGPFDLIHARALLMHIAGRLDVLRRLASWLAPGGWLVVEEPDFGMWLGDFDPIWSAHPGAWHEAFPNGSLSQGRALLRQIHQLGLEDVGADAELDIVQPGTPLAEFYRLSLARTAGPLMASGLLASDDAAALLARVDEPDFLACAFAYIGAWGRRPGPRPGEGEVS